MKPNRTYLYIFLSSLALVVVLAIQVSWILRTASAKEELFNEKANLVLSQTAQALSADTLARNGLGNLTDAEVHKIDSLLARYMQMYNIRLEYSFAVNPGPFLAQNQAGFMGSLDPVGTYKACIEEPGKNTLELKLMFPEKRQYILAEMGTPFITSVLLIVLVLVMSWRTVLSLLREKRVAEHTTDLLNNMTHEFKTPLTNIALAGKMLVKEGNIGHEEKIRRYSSVILQENEKLTRQVEQVLGMTAFERGEIPLQATESDFHTLIHEAVQDMALQLESRQGTVVLDLRATRFGVMGDKAYLVSVLGNLLDNAVKYSPGKPELTVRTEDRGADLLLEVSDKGMGIAGEHQQKVFDAFFRVSTGNVHDVKGFGLGLAYVKKIVELHGGTVGLRSEKGKGSTFTVTLPHA